MPCVNTTLAVARERSMYNADHFLQWERSMYNASHFFSENIVCLMPTTFKDSKVIRGCRKWIDSGSNLKDSPRSYSRPFTTKSYSPSTPAASIAGCSVPLLLLLWLPHELELGHPKISTKVGATSRFNI